MNPEATQEQVQVWVECGADTNSTQFPFTRKHYMHPSVVDQFRMYNRNIGVYQTVMHYLNPTWFQNEKGKWILNAADSLKYGDLYLDFDYKMESDEDFDMIRSDVLTAIRYLKLILSVDVSQIHIYFSGFKGVHLTVDAQVLGVPAHYSLNHIFKEIASDIANYTLFKTMDTAIYDDKRMFRMVNSYNKKGERYKIPLTYEELCQLSLSDIREMAIQPRFLEKPALLPSPKAKLSLKKYIEKWTQMVSRQKEFQGKIRKLESLPACIQAMVDKIHRETIDERNNSATSLASFYFQQGIEREEALERMRLWGEEKCVPTLPYREISTIVHSVYNGQYRYGCGTFHRLSGVCDKENCPLFKKGEQS
jgi:hypothetical protein